MRRTLVLFATMMLGVVASGSLAMAASSLNNGNFETGNLSGWSVDTANGGSAIATSSYSYWRWGEDWQLHLYWMPPQEGSYLHRGTSSQTSPTRSPNRLRHLMGTKLAVGSSSTLTPWLSLQAIRVR
jgi:hypothetical protein